MSTTFSPHEMRNHLRSAFRKLRAAGFFARMAWQCCQSCGIAAVPGGGKYCFYHMQDRDKLDAGKPFYLAFSEGRGPEIIRILNQSGITTEWEGTDAKRICVTGLTKKENPTCPSAV